jgi:hypothetical protein
MKIDSVLKYDPFAGDFGDGERTLSDKIVKGRKEHTCDMCFGIIVVGEIHRARVEVEYDTEINTYRYCNACCEAMSIDIEHDCMTDEVLKRYKLADSRRKL